MNFRQLYETVEDQSEQVRILVGMVCHAAQACEMPVGFTDRDFKAFAAGRIPRVKIGGLPGELWITPDLRHAEPYPLPPEAGS